MPEEIIKENNIEGEKIEKPEARPEERAEVKEEIKSQPTKTPPPVPSAVPLKEPEIKEDIERLKCEEHRQQIQGLVDLAFTKGLGHAIEVAKNLNNPHVLDEFHDVLTDQLYNELIERGGLKKF